MKQVFKWILLTAALFSGQGYAHSVADRDVSAGALLYAKCIGCHSPSFNRTGPKHCGLLGRSAGSVQGFEFTQAMKNSGIIWSQKTLDDFLMAPLDMIPGTSMGFSGIDSFKERAQLIAYLGTLTDDNRVCR